MYKIKHDKEFNFGYNVITTINEKENNTMMDFGILRISKGQKEILFEEEKEICLLLTHGEVTLIWKDLEKTINRNNCFHEEPWVLHVPKQTKITIIGVKEDTELTVTMTYNDKNFESKLYTPEHCKSQYLEKNSVKGYSAKIVRRIFDYKDADYSNLVCGEVVDFPGEWSNYPSHHHEQPEICYYKFYPHNGYGFSKLGNETEMVKDSDAVKMLDDLSHPQVTVPGYSMYYFWVIRHLEGNPYTHN